MSELEDLLASLEAGPSRPAAASAAPASRPAPPTDPKGDELERMLAALDSKDTPSPRAAPTKTTSVAPAKTAIAAPSTAAASPRTTDSPRFTDSPRAYDSPRVQAALATPASASPRGGNQFASPRGVPSSTASPRSGNADMDAILNNMNSAFSEDASAGGGASLSRDIVEVSSSDPRASERALTSLINQALDAPSRDRLLASDALGSLLLVLATPLSPHHLALATQGLANLAQSPAVRDRLSAPPLSRAFTLLVTHLTHPDPAVVDRSLMALLNACMSHPANADLAHAAGAGRALPAHLALGQVGQVGQGGQSAQPQPAPRLELALKCVINLGGHAGVRTDLSRAGAWTRLAAILRDGSEREVALCAWAVGVLGTGEAELEQGVRDGVVTALAAALRARDALARDRNAWAALVNWSTSKPAQKELVQGGVVAVAVRVAGEGGERSVMALQMLQNLAGGKECHEALRAAEVPRRVVEVLRGGGEAVPAALAVITNCAIDKQMRQALVAAGAKQAVEPHRSGAYAKAANNALSNLSLP